MASLSVGLFCNSQVGIIVRNIIQTTCFICDITHSKVPPISKDTKCPKKPIALRARNHSLRMPTPASTWACNCHHEQATAGGLRPYHPKPEFGKLAWESCTLR